MNIDLSGTRALVTGSSRGIGAAIALRLLSSGASVAVHYNTGAEAAERLRASFPGKAFALGADISDPEACISLFDRAARSMGGVDVLVNNAGVAESSPLEAGWKDWIACWERAHAVNLRAAAILTRAAVKLFLSNGGGRVITIASRASFRGDTPEYLAYAATKGGLVALTRSVARGFGKQGVKAFLVAPGFTRTDMAKPFIDAYGSEYAMSDIALDRMTEPDDIAPMVAFLASGLADHATGCTVDMNAGSYVH